MTDVKPNIRSMVSYYVPQHFKGVKLNQNESPSDLPASIKEQIFQRLKKTAWNRYPHDYPETLINKISGYARCTASGILAGNSSNELIQIIIYACCDSGDQILTVTPTFSVYKQAAAVMNINTITIPLKEDFSFDVPLLKEKIKKSGRIKVVILASPNNPTGTVIDIREIQEISQNIPALVVVDEAYFEFYGISALGLIEKCRNIIILRTFSKALRGAGIRLGYLMASPEVVDELKKVKLPFSVGFFQQVAGEVILNNRDFLERSIQAILREKERVFAALDSLPATAPVPSKANFILFRSTQHPAEEVYNKLYREGILVRSYQSPELKDMLRVTIGTESENTLFLETLGKVLMEI